MKITNHKFDDYWHALSKDVGGALTDLRFIVMHYTAGGDGKGTRDYFLKSPAEKGKNQGTLVYGSAHLLVDRDGVIWQLVPFNKVARHAGKSSWQGLDSLNQYAIGIEIANYGWLNRQADGTYMRLGETPRFKPEDVMVGPMPNTTEEKGWENYPAAQLAAVESVTLALLAHYTEIREIVGHQDISPGRKFDPGPAFPLQRFKNLVTGRGDDQVDRPPERFEVSTSLNIRGGPGTEHGLLKISPLKKGTKVLKTDEQGDWYYVKLTTGTKQSGWVNRRYLTML
jgi:N-acetylmuramoyl-L-alanine amidase